MGFSRQEYWSGLPLPSPVDYILLDLSTMTHLSWVAPHSLAWFHWVRQGCGPVIRLANCLWLWFPSVCPLMPSLSAYHLTWVSLTLDVGSLFTDAPYLVYGVGPLSRCPWPLVWGGSSQLLPLVLEKAVSKVNKNSPSQAAAIRESWTSRCVSWI